MAPYDPSEPGYEYVDTDVPKDVTDDDIYSIAAAATDQALDQANPNEIYDLPDGATYVPIISKYGGYYLTFEDGNIYLGAANQTDPDTFIYDQGLISSPDGVQLFHYYTDTMEELGVSRFRLSELADLPITSDLVSLASVNYDSDPNTPGFIVAVDTAGSAFYTVICDYEDDQDSKFFLVKDVEAGIATLQNRDLMFTVTGGPVTECAFWALQTELPGGVF